MAVAELLVNFVTNTAQFQKGINSVTKDLNNIGKNFQSVGKQIALLTAPLAAFGGFGIKAFADFDHAMTESQAIMGNLSDAMKDDMANAAKEVAKTTTFSAAEAGKAYFYLASAGMDAAQSIAALPAVAAFAQAGTFDMAKATDLLTDAQTALGLSSKDAGENLKNLTELSDVLVGANTLANASVEQFSTALTNKAGIALANLNKDMYEGVAALTVFADAGIKGEAAGTLLNTILQQLPAASIKNKEAFKELGFEIYDANGKMKNIADLARNYTEITNGLTDEQLGQVASQLGLNRQLKVGMDLLRGQGDQLEKRESDLRKMDDITKEISQKQLLSFNNQLKLAKNNLELAGIEIGQVLVPYIIKLSEKIVELSKWFVDLDQTTKNNIITIGALLVTLGPLLFIFGKILVMIAGLIKGITGLTTALMAGKGVIAIFASATGLGLIIIALTAVSVAIYTFREEIGAALTWVYEQAKHYGDAVLTVVKGFADLILSVYGTSTDEIGKGFTKLYDLVIDVLKRMKAGWLDAFKIMGEIATVLYNGVVSVMEGIASVAIKVFGFLERNLGVFNRNAAAAFGTMKRGLEETRTPVKNLEKDLSTLDKTLETHVKNTDRYNAAKERSIKRSQLKEEATKKEALATEALAAIEEDENKTVETLNRLKEESEKKLTKSTKAKKDNTLAREEAKKAKELEKIAAKELKDEIARLSEVTAKNTEAINDWGEAINSTLNQTLGKSAGILNLIGNALTGTSGGIGQMLSQLAKGLVEGADALQGVQGPIAGIFNSLGQGKGLAESIFGGGRPTGVEGPLMKDGSFSQGIFSGANTANAWMAASSGILEGITKLGQDTVSTFEGIGQGAGAAFGAYFGGPLGAALGEQFGSLVGKGIGKGIKKIFGAGSQNPATIARREFEKQLNEIIDGKNIKLFNEQGILVEMDKITVGAKDRWNNANWTEGFNAFEQDAVTAYQGVAKGLQHLLGITEDVAMQMALVLMEQMGGSLENLGLLIMQLDMPIEQFESALIEAFLNGEIGAHEFEVAMQGITKGFEQAELAAKDVDTAVKFLFGAQGQGRQGIESFKKLASAAMAEGFKTFESFVNHAVATGKFTTEQGQIFMAAMASRGIGSFEELANASDRVLIGILAEIDTIRQRGGGAFFEFAEQASKDIQQIEKSWKSLDNSPSRIEKEVHVKVTTSGNPEVLESFNGNAFTRSGASVNIKEFAKGGVFNQRTFFDIGSMAEKGPEAIMPLARLPDGRLGVLTASSSGNSNNSDVVINIDARGAEIGFARKIRQEIENFYDKKNRSGGTRL